MRVLDVKQGTQAWFDARLKYFTASEASIMMGESPYATRGDLLRVKATGSGFEVSEWTKEFLFKRGHEIEAKARPLAEKIIGDELYPAMGVSDDGQLSASFDGITLTEDVIWECKQWNESKAQTVRHGMVPSADVWQVIQQLVVSGAEKCLYMVTDGTEQGTVFCWFSGLEAEEHEQALRVGWTQFAKDLAEWKPEPVAAEVVGHAPETLPALRIELTGMVTASNLAEFHQTALALIGSVNTDLQTDQDFADAEKAVKWCGEVESRLDAAKQHALSQTRSIDELFRTLDDIKAEARTKRLELDKLVKARKEAIRGEIFMAGTKAFTSHVVELEKRTKPVPLTYALPDFAGVMKGKKTVKSLRDAVDAELAKAKIETSAMADLIQANLRTLDELAKEYRHLFSDLQHIADKAQDDFTALVKTRIADHKEAEARRIEQIRAEEERKARVRVEAEQAKIQAEAQAKAEQARMQAAYETISVPFLNKEEQKARYEQAEKATQKELPPLKLGEICSLLGFTVTEDFLRHLGFQPIATERSAKLYRHNDFYGICHALIKHIGKAINEGVPA